MGITDNQKVVNYFNAMLNYFEDLKKVKASVGIHAEKGKYNVDKAVWNEFGTTHITQHDYNFVKNDVQVHIPKGSNISIKARLFIRLYLYPSAVIRLTDEAVRNIETFLANKRLNNSMKTAVSTVDNIGRKAKSIMKENITNSTIHAPNKDLTVALKGFNYPLYDTGDMLDAIDSKVERRGI